MLVSIVPAAEASDRISRAGFSQLSGGVWCRIVSLGVKLSYVAVVPKRLCVMALLTWARCSWDPKKFGQGASLAVNERDMGAISPARRRYVTASSLQGRSKLVQLDAADITSRV